MAGPFPISFLTIQNNFQKGFVFLKKNVYLTLIRSPLWSLVKSEKNMLGPILAFLNLPDLSSLAGRDICAMMTCLSLGETHVSLGETHVSGEETCVWEGDMCMGGRDVSGMDRCVWDGDRCVRISLNEMEKVKIEKFMWKNLPN